MTNKLKFALRKGSAKVFASNMRSSRSLIIAGVALVAAACSSPEERVENFYESGVEFMEQGDLGRANVQFRRVLQINEAHVPTLLALAQLAERRQDLRAMFGILQQVNRLDPTNLYAHVQLGKLYLLGSDETAALEHAEEALALDPENIDAIGLKAGVQLRIGDTVRAVELARQVIEVDPDNAEATTVLATERALANDSEGALAELDRALEVNPRVAILQLLRIRLLAQMDRSDDVLASYAGLVELFPDEPLYRRAYAAELVKSEQLAEAQAQVEKLVELEPDNLDAKLDVIRLVNAQQGVDAAEVRLDQFVNAQPDNLDLKFAFADFYIEQERLDSAESILKPIADGEDISASLKARNKLSAIMLLNQDIEQATAVIDQILIEDANNTEALIRRAGLRIDNENYDQGISDLRTAINNEPDSSAAILLMARALELQGNVDFARAEYAKAFEVSDKEARVANLYAKFLARRQNQALAEDILLQSLATDPNDIENLKLLAAVRLDQQDWQGADEAAGLIEALESQNDGVLVRDIRSVALAGLEDYDRVIDLLSSDAQTAPLGSRPLSTLVTAYMRSERSDEAEALLQNVIRSDPGNYEARILLSQVLGARGETGNAEATLIEAVSVNPTRAEGFELLYRYYLRTNQYEKAVDLIDDGLDRTPQSYALQFFKADILLTTGELEEAYSLYQNLLQRRPEDKIVANNFVSLTSDLRTDEASIARALEIAQVLDGDDNPFFQDSIGWAHYRAGNYDEALTYLTNAKSRASENAEILYHLGAAQIAAGNTDEGRENLEKALQFGGDGFRFADDIRELLQQG